MKKEMNTLHTTRQDFSYYWVHSYIRQPNRIIIKSRYTYTAFNDPHAQRLLAMLIIQYKEPFRAIGQYANEIIFDSGQKISTYAYFDRSMLPYNIHGLLHYNLPAKGPGIRGEDYRRNRWAREAIRNAPRWHGGVLYGEP